MFKAYISASAIAYYGEYFEAEAVVENIEEGYTDTVIFDRVLDEAA